MKAGREVVREETDSKEEFKENMIALVIVLLIIVGAALWIYTRITAPPEAINIIDVPIGNSPVLGTNESMTVVIFSDFECPYCAEFAKQTFPTIRELAEKGRIRFVFKQFPLDLHPHAMAAAHASLCADEQGKFWEYHDVLYENSDALTNEDLVRYAQELELDIENFNSCLAAPPTQVVDEKKLGQSLGVAGTPTFFFNGRKVAGAISTEQFIAEIERATE